MSDEGEKVFDPTPQKLEEERKKGNVPKSMDLSAAAGFIGLFLALFISGKAMVTNAGGQLQGLIDNSHFLSRQVLEPGGLELVHSWMNAILIYLAPVFILPFAMAAISLAAQQAFVFGLPNIEPKLSRIGLLSNAQNKFGPTGIVQFLKSLIKLVIVGTVLFWYLNGKMDVLVGAIRSDEKIVAYFLAETFFVLTAITCVIFLVIGLLDILWQRYDHARKLRMTFQEIKEQHKQSEGDQFIKQQRRQRGHDIATNRMMQDVPSADVIIVNPTHYAVALKWTRNRGEAPTCVAKGVDEVAARIRKSAAEHAIPIHRDPPTARAIHDTVDIGSEINPDHYKAVAAAIRFAEKLRAKASKGGLA